MITFSVITIVKNAEKYLVETMESILSQKGIDTLYNLEYLLVYAPSTDNTLNIIRKYQARYPHIIRMIEDSDQKGIAHAMNLGVLNASGDIIAHLHADDLYENDTTFVTVLDLFKQNPKTKWLFSSIRIIDENGQTLRIERKDYSYKRLKRCCIIPHPCVFMKKEIYKKIGLYNPKYKFAMDYELWRRVIKKYRPNSYPDLVFARFRVHSGSTTEVNQNQSQMELETIKRVYNLSFINMIKYFVLKLIKAKDTPT